jgi:hypothetical protein
MTRTYYVLKFYNKMFIGGIKNNMAVTGDIISEAKF